MNILVLGGTGFIGPHAVRKLVAGGHRVTVLHRGRTHAELPGAEVMTGDYHNLAALQREFLRLAPEVVLDMIPITEQDARNVMAAFRGIARRVVAASSQDVYRAWGVVLGLEPGPVDPVLREDSAVREKLYPYRGRKLPVYRDWDFDNYDKVLVERVFLSDPALPGTILRLPMVYGPGDPVHRPQAWLKAMDEGKPVIEMEQGPARWRGPLGYVEDVGTAIALAVADDRAAGRIYNIAEPDVRSAADWVREIGRAAGWRGEIREVPDGTLGGPWSGYNAAQHCLTDSSRIRRELGYREEAPREEALRRTVEWERAAGLARAAG